MNNTKNTKHILVVGGAGYIGSYVNQLLHESGYKTVILDNLCTGDKRTLINGHFEYGDLGDPLILNQLFKKYSFVAVMHFAAFIDVGESVSNPSKYYRNNVSNTLNLLDAMLEHGIKNFIFSSSAAVYGNPENSFLDESHPKKPINPYGQTKKIVEDILKNYHFAYGLNSTCLRYFNAAGGDPKGRILNFRLNPTNLIPIGIRSIFEKNKEITIFGVDYPTSDGTCVRDYVHIHDLATAHILALNELLADGGCLKYNLGNGQGFSVREVLSSIEKISGKKLTIKIGVRRNGDPPMLIANATKAKNALSWNPIYTNLDSIVHDAWLTMKHQENKFDKNGELL